MQDCRRRAVSIVALALALAATAALAQDVPPSEEQAAKLAVDEECEGAAEEDGSCSLSMRQLRGDRVQASALTAPHGGPGPVSASGDLSVTAADMLNRLSSLRDDAIGEAGEEGNKAWSQELKTDSGAPLYTFYLYRAVSEEAYDPINVNAANIGGVLWYLHHEVVIQYPRKFDITRIERFKVQMRATAPLMKLGMHFGPRAAFDKGQCTGPFVCGRKTGGAMPAPEFCDGAFSKSWEAKMISSSNKTYGGPFEWQKYGYFVGCNKLGEYPFPMFKVYYPEAAWYSLPGPCPSKTFDAESDSCIASEPGGLCTGIPTGAGDCTWSYEMMGEVKVDDLIGMSVDQLDASGGREYDPFTDSGTKMGFWNNMNSTAANAERIKKLSKLFADKYPDQELDENMPSPPCDFEFGKFYREFWWKLPFEGECEYINSGECYEAAVWGKSTGIYETPDWFPGLTGDSPLHDFQQLLFQQGKAECPYRPCGPGEKARVAA